MADTHTYKVQDIDGNVQTVTGVERVGDYGDDIAFFLAGGGVVNFQHVETYWCVREGD